MTIEDNKYFCKRCGKKYDWYNQEPPENATFYWVPHCPRCNAKMTDNVVDNIWMDVITDSNHRLDGVERHISRIHGCARLYHGKLADVGVDGLIERAKWFDDKASHDFYGPDAYHDVAFQLRKQARRKLKEQQ